MSVAGNVFDFSDEGVANFQPEKPKLNFLQTSFQEFQDTHNIDPFFYDFAGELLTPYRALYEQGPWIAGGFLTRSLQKENQHNFGGDVDIWFSEPEHIGEYMHDLESGRFGLNATKDKNFSSQYSFSYMVTFRGKEYKIQLISYRTFDCIENLLRKFDLFSAMIATDGVNIFYEKDKSLNCAKNKILSYNWDHVNGSTSNPDARLVLKRYSKFIANGYSVTDREIELFARLIKELSVFTNNLQENYDAVLKDN